MIYSNLNILILFKKWKISYFFFYFDLLIWSFAIRCHQNCQENNDYYENFNNYFIEKEK